MKPLSLRFVDMECPSSFIPEFTAQGFELWQAKSQTPWLSLVNLSDCKSSEVSKKLALSPAKNQVALLNPEQTELASMAMQSGAQDYLLLPVEPQQLMSLMLRLKRVEQLDSELVVASPISRQLLMLAHRAAATEATVLLTGESGTGKEPMARYIHRHSNRADKPFVAINCAAIPESILESVLFGHVKGAFTGALNEQAGKFEQANGGTLMLDEIGEMPLQLQAKLLRVLQEREIERIGGHKTIKLDIRVIAATNKDLRKAVAAAEFREDLFYRLDVLPLKILPLRQRRDDILPLAEHFLNKYQTGDCQPACHFSDYARRLMMNYDWPGNVRELENTIQRALVMRRGVAIQAAELGIDAIEDPELIAEPAEQGLKASKRHAEFQYIVDTLKRFNGHRGQSAEALGITTRALRYKLVQMREEGIDIDSILRQKGHAA